MDKEVNFTKYLTNCGYKTYRLIVKSDWNKEAKAQAERILDTKPDGILFKDESSFYVPCDFNHTYLRANYNVLQNGGISTYFIKDNVFDNPIIFGLHEKDMLPTLIHPRPLIKLIFECGFECYVDLDEYVERVLQEIPNEEILSIGQFNFCVDLTYEEWIKKH